MAYTTDRADSDRFKASPVGVPLDTSPTSSVPGMPSHKHMHYHADGAGGYYQHDHPHSHDVRHNPQDNMDENLHEHHSPANKAARLERLAKQALEHPDPLVRQGGRELMKAAGEAWKVAGQGAIIEKSARPAQARNRMATLAKTAGLVDHEDWHMRGIGRQAERELNVELQKARRTSPQVDANAIAKIVKAAIDNSGLDQALNSLIRKVGQ